MSKLLIAAMVASFVLAQTAPPKASLEGKVTDASGQPVERVKLTLQLELAPPAQPGRDAAGSSSAQSDKDGTFTFTSLEAGRFRLIAEKNPFLKQTYGARPGSAMGTILDIAAGQAVTGIRMALTPMGSISGRVLDENNEPLRGIVELYRKGYSPGLRGFERIFARSNDLDGSFGIFDLPPGQYYLRASADSAAPSGELPKEGHVPTFYGGATDASVAVPLQVFSGSSLAGSDIHIANAPYVAVLGRVTGENLPRDVTLLPRTPLGPANAKGARVAADGTFEIAGTPPGAYRLISSTLNGASFGWTDVEVGRSGLDNVGLNVQPRFELSGRVTIAGAEGQPLAPGMQVRLTPDNLGSNQAFGPVDQEGNFVLHSVVNAKFQLGVSSLPPGTYLAEMRLNRQAALKTDVDLTGGNPGVPLILVLKNTPGEIDGSVHAEDGNPRPGAIVTLIPDVADAQPAPERLYRRASTDQNGNFVLKDVAPGKYRLYGWDQIQDRAELDPEVLKPNQTKSVAVTVEDSSRQAISLTLIRAGT